jgi:hypothetical protein
VRIITRHEKIILVLKVLAFDIRHIKVPKENSVASENSQSTSFGLVTCPCESSPRRSIVTIIILWSICCRMVRNRIHKFYLSKNGRTDLGSLLTSFFWKLEKHFACPCNINGVDKSISLPILFSRAD